MPRALALALLLCCSPWLASCNRVDPPVAAAAPSIAAATPPSGEHLAYVVGCVNCHHQTPKEIINAPPLLVARAYSLPQFTRLMRSGVALDGRDLYAQGSIMGIVAREQLSHLTDAEIAAIHGYLREGWSAERAASEEAKIATFPPPTFDKG